MFLALNASSLPYVRELEWETHVLMALPNVTAHFLQAYHSGETGKAPRACVIRIDQLDKAEMDAISMWYFKSRSYEAWNLQSGQSAW